MNALVAGLGDDPSPGNLWGRAQEGRVKDVGQGFRVRSVAMGQEIQKGFNILTTTAAVLLQTNYQPSLYLQLYIFSARGLCSIW